jgi:hypothetical protein
MTNSQHIYEVRPRKDHRGFDLISDALRSVACGTPGQIQAPTLATAPSIAVDHITLR